MDNNLTIIPSERIVNKIYIIRGRKVMIDRDLAELYGVKTKELNLAVKRNVKRFPSDFMFQLGKEEFKNLRLQIETSSWGGTRYQPFVFTEQGVAMLASVLNSERAISINIQIIRTFVKVRELMATNEILQRKIMELEKKYGRHDEKIKRILAIVQLLSQEDGIVKDVDKNEVGFKI